MLERLARSKLNIPPDDAAHTMLFCPIPAPLTSLKEVYIFQADWVICAKDDGITIE
jgi:hypothetical protein